MSKRERVQSEERRRSAQARHAERAQRAAEAVSDLQRARVAEAAKTTRLRALRLAKEASDREAAARTLSEKAIAAPKRPRKAAAGSPEA